MEERLMRLKLKRKQRRVWGMFWSAAVMLIAAAIVYVLKLPTPEILLMTALVTSTAVYGLSAGVTGGIVFIGYIMFAYSTDHSFIHYKDEEILRLVVTVAAVMFTVFVIGKLKSLYSLTLDRLTRANQILEMDNSLLKEAAETDSLTGVMNRFAFRRDYESYEHCDVHVMKLDLDDFKSINEKFGRSVGDFILKNVGAVLEGAFEKHACYRYGADEFLVVAVNMSGESFMKSVRELSKGFNELRNTDLAAVGINFSAGYVHGVVEHHDDLRLMLRAAEENLNKARKTGKNKVVGSEYSRAIIKKLRKQGNGAMRK